MSNIDIAYKDIVENYACENNPIVFNNKGNEHAAIVLSKIFKYSKEKIRILAHSLEPNDVTNDPEYFQNLKDFTFNVGIVDVLLEQEPEKPSDALKHLMIGSIIQKDKIRIKIAINPVLINNNNGETKNVNFTLGDDHIFRLETDVINRTAICSFNNVEMTNRLIDVFDKLYDNSPEYDINKLLAFINR